MRPGVNCARPWSRSIVARRGARPNGSSCRCTRLFPEPVGTTMATPPPNANVVFLPWVRQGAAASITTDDTLGQGQRGAIDVTASLTVNTSPPVSVPVRLRGPADVVGIDPHEIVRMDPRPNSTDF